MSSCYGSVHLTSGSWELKWRKIDHANARPTCKTIQKIVKHEKTVKVHEKGHDNTKDGYNTRLTCVTEALQQSY